LNFAIGSGPSRCRLLGDLHCQTPRRDRCRSRYVDVLESSFYPAGLTVLGDLPEWLDFARHKCGSSHIAAAPTCRALTATNHDCPL